MSISRQHILDEIKRTAERNGGTPLGRLRFTQESGIKESDWRGVYWARWNDVLAEAGFGPNSLTEARDDDTLLNHIADFAVELGRIPVKSEMRLKKRSDPSFPNEKTYDRFGPKIELLARLREHCKAQDRYASVVLLLDSALGKDTLTLEESEQSEPENGFIYMLKAGRYYKVGRSKSFSRRSRELAIQLPEVADTVHVISTDDPVGIEAYWHKRFEQKRLNGEWFALSAQDVKAFKRRKFM
jgi:hypothetical protein